MEQILQNLITALRGSGVRVSLSETMDAMQAALLAGYDDRQVLKDSLSAALAKSVHEKEIFEECFDRFFSLNDLSDFGTAASLMPPVEAGEADAPLTRMLLAGDAPGLALSMRDAADRVDMTAIRFFTQKSLYVQRILKGMGIEGLERDMGRLSGEDSLAARQKLKALEGAKAFLFEGVRDFVERQFSLFAGSATQETIDRYLRNLQLSNLERQDYHRMHIIIQKMVKRLKDLHSRRRTTHKRGALDLKKTLRANVAYQGLLFVPQWKDKKIDRPDIVALCDVSRSVETVARFMLLFLYSLNELVAKIRSFIFCSNLVDVSHVFEAYPVEEAVERLHRGLGVGIRMGSTDYGQAFHDFKDKWLDKVTNRTTVIILGDARNNYGDPQTGILRLIHERSKRLIWLNPEPPGFYGTGDSEMKRYLPYCSFVRKCSTVSHLERVVDFLLTTQG